MTNILERNIAGRNMKVEFGRVGMLSNAAIFMSYGDTVILTNVNASEKPREGIDFFPLSVEYEERLYAVGKIPGGFIKREGRPSENAILFGRAVDRPLRPLFPKDFRNDVCVVATALSVEQDNSPEVAAMIGAAAALASSVGIMDCYPLVPAIFAVYLLWNNKTILFYIGLSTGMGYFMSFQTMTKYLFIIVVSFIGIRFYSWINKRCSGPAAAVITALTTCAMGISAEMTGSVDKIQIILSIAESAVIFGTVVITD